MKVILNQTVPKVGKQGTVVTVAGGYARNYLFPRGLAILADKKQVAALEIRQARIAERTAGQKEAAEALKEQLHGKTIKIEGKAGHETTKLFGAITSQDVADEIKKQLKVTVEKKQVALVEPIKRLGHHQVQLDLHRDVDAMVTVHVFDPNAPVEEAPAEKAAPKAEPEAEPDSDSEELVEA